MGNELACISKETSASLAAAGPFPQSQIFMGGNDGSVCLNYCQTEYVGARLFNNESGEGVECACYSADIKPTDIATLTVYGGGCDPNKDQYKYIKRTTTFGQHYCTNVPADIPPISTVSTIPDCFSQCSGSAGASVFFQADDNTFQCFCQYSQTEGFQPCGPGRAYTYNHRDFPASSGLARRTWRDRQEAQVQRRRLGHGGDMEYCPAGLSACKVESGSTLGGYECIDTNSELESCGGCAFGLYGSSDHDSTSLGVDCDAMPGTLPGGSTCERGVCVAMACEKGHFLVDGDCKVDLD